MLFHRYTDGIPTENTDFWKAESQRLLLAAQSGDVLVTPGVSECEKRIKNMALKQRLRLILSAKKANPSADTSALEQQIDLLVYHLYGLTYDEVLIVDPATPITREEYEKGSEN